MRTGRREAILRIERAMVRIRRSQTRRSIGRLMERELGTKFNMTHSFVVDALDEACEIPGEKPSVGTLAEYLGVDPSRASRMVAEAIRGGYLRRVASQADGRRTYLELTRAGRKLLNTASRFRRRLFSRAMTSWSEHDCAEFARLLTNFIEPPQDARTLVAPAHKFEERKSSRVK
jgi:DNA-binding MarR family transcriptional regulator